MHPILYQWSPGGFITWYTVLTYSGYLLGIVWLRTQLKYHLPAPPRIFWALVATLFVAALSGGKLGFFWFEWKDVSDDPWFYLKHPNVGWVFWTGVLAACAAGLGFQAWYNRRHRPRAYLPIADYFITGLSMGHVLGRIGCFLQGCCHGRPTDFPVSVIFTKRYCDVPKELLGVPLHPTQLYEAFGSFVAAVALIGWVLPAIRNAKLRYGTAFFGYLLYYSLLRFSLEFLRGDERGRLLSSALSPSQWVSLFAGLTAAIVLWKRGVVERDPKGRSIYKS